MGSSASVGHATVSRNTVRNANADGAPTTDAIVLAGLDRFLVQANRITDDEAPSSPRCRYAINLDSGSNGQIADNFALDADHTTRGIRNNGDTSVEVRNNKTVQDAIRTVASTGSLTLLDGYDAFEVTGTTTITAIAAGYPGRLVTLKFNGALTVEDDNNLKLVGDFTTSANDVLTLVSDGTNWFEVSRSAN